MLYFSFKVILALRVAVPSALVISCYFLIWHGVALCNY